MKKSVISALMIISVTAYSQVGINNTSPKATLDINAKTTDGSMAEGLIAPRLTGDQIKAADGKFGSDQKGTLVYATAAVGTASTQTINITSAGYYYYDGSLWQKISNTNAGNWALTGNAGTAASTAAIGSAVNNNFAGTTDANDFVLASNNKETMRLNTDNQILVGTTSIPTGGSNARIIVNNGSTAGAIQIKDGTQAEGKFLVSDANGLATWRDTTGSATVISSTAGTSTTLGTTFVYTGANATITTAGYYIISPRLVTDKNASGCGQFLAYNLSKSSTTTLNLAFNGQDVHMPGGPGIYDFMFTSNVAYLTAGTYYMLVRYGGGCTSNVTRSGLPQNSFTLTLLK